MLQNILTWVIALVIPLNSIAAVSITANVSLSELTNEQRVKRIDRTIQLIEELRTHIDRGQFDLDALLLQLDYDKEEIVRFVKEEISFEQYPGLLRGAKGTLISRSGNALDQSVLLATMLKDAGFDARIVRGNISESDARKILNQMRPPTSLPPLSDAKAFQKTISQFGNPKDISIEELMRYLSDTTGHAKQIARTKYGADAGRIASKLLKEIKKNKVWKGSLPVAEAQDYYWVQSRFGSNQSWIDIHPAWTSDGAGPLSTSLISIFADEVPEQHIQRVELSLIGERVIGNKREIVTLLKRGPHPAANLIAVPISLMFAPMGNFETIDQLAEALPNAEIFIPLLNQTPGDYIIDLRGYFVPAAEAQSMMAGVFREDARAVSDAAAALSRLDQSSTQNPKSSTALTGLWIDFLIHLPNGETREYRRTIIDTIKGNRESDEWSVDPKTPKELRDMILGVRHTLLETGHGSEAYKLDESFRYVHQLAKQYQYIFENEAGNASTSKPGLPSVVPPFIHMAMFSIFDQAWDEDRSKISYRSTPSLLTIEYKSNTSADNQVTMQTTVDVVSNERRVYVREGNQLALSPEGALYIGVYETLAEKSISMPDNGVSWNAGRATLSALDRGSKFTLIKPDTREKVTELQVVPITERAIQRELDEGFWIIAPTMSASKGLGQYSWWRVHPDTGNTLGMIQSGQGANALDYLTLISIAYVVIVSVCIIGTILVFKKSPVILPDGSMTQPENQDDLLDPCLTLGIPASSLAATIIINPELWPVGGFLFASAMLMTWLTY